MNDYQEKATSTDIYPPDLKGLLCVALGLVSEGLGKLLGP